MLAHHARQFFAGLGLGSIALAIFWGCSVIAQLMELHQQHSGYLILLVGLLVSGFTFLIQILLGIGLLTPREHRYTAYGILAMSLISAVVAQQGCVLISQIGRQ